MEGKVAVFRGAKQPFELRSYPVPDPEPGAIVLKTSMANICGSDLHIWRGEMSELYPPNASGYVVGHEMTGRVYALGDGVTTDSLGQSLNVGDRVAHCYFYPCRRCRVCLRGDLYCCPFKGRFPRVAGKQPYFVAAYGEYYYLHPGHYVFKVPDEIPDELIAPINCALSQVLFGLQHIGLRFGDYLVVQGAGGLGLYATAVAKEMGAAKVIVLDAIASRLELAKAFGADEVISIKEHATVDERIGVVKELTGGYGADVAMDVVGQPRVIAEGLQLLRDGGRYLEIGCICPGQTMELEPASMVRHSKRLVAILQYDPNALADAIVFVQRNLKRLPFDKILSHKFAFEDINEAFQQSEWFGRQADAPVTRAALVTS